MNTKNVTKNAHPSDARLGGAIAEATRARYLRDMRHADIPQQPAKGSETYDEKTGIATIGNARRVLASYRVTVSSNVLRYDADRRLTFDRTTRRRES